MKSVVKAFPFTVELSAEERKAIAKMLESNAEFEVLKLAELQVFVRVKVKAESQSKKG
jgi:hypothetical protein